MKSLGTTGLFPIDAVMLTAKSALFWNGRLGQAGQQNLLKQASYDAFNCMHLMDIIEISGSGVRW